MTAASAALQGLTVESAEMLTAKDGTVSLLLGCRQNGETVRIRTLAAQNVAETLLPAEAYLHHQVDVKGMIQCGEEGAYLLVFQPEGLMLHP